MLFRRDVLDGLANGTITLAFRRWRRPTVKPGGRLRTANGVLAIDAVDVVHERDISVDDARRAGYEHRAALLRNLNARRDGRIHRIALRFAGPDPRVARRNADDLDASEIDNVRRRLDRLDRASRRGPWTVAALALIDRRPGCRAADLAAQLRMETLPFKRNIRRLKEIGLTESLEVGYRLSPRGRAVLGRMRGARNDAPAAGKPRRGRTPRLSRETVIDAGEAIIGRDGIEALTMRSVAKELRSSPMAIYRHVRHKDELLVLLLDRLAAGLPRPRLSGTPRARLMTLCRVMHDGLSRHPWAVSVLAAGDLMGPSVLWLIEDILAAFVGAGLTPAQAAASFDLVWQFTVGTLTVRHATARRTAALDRAPFQLATLAAADARKFPTLAEVVKEWSAAWDQDNYDDGLAALLDGLLRRA